MFSQIFVVGIIAVVLLVVAPLVRKVMVRATERKYAATLVDAMEQAEFSGKMGYLLRAGEYGDILSMQDVLAVRKAYMIAVQEEGHRLGKEGFPNYVKFTKFYGLDENAEVAYMNGHAAGMSEGLYAY